jgi:hypothetical protein
MWADKKTWMGVTIAALALIALFVVGFVTSGATFVQSAFGYWQGGPWGIALFGVPAWSVASLFAGLALLFAVFAVRQRRRLWFWLFWILLLLFALNVSRRFAVETQLIAKEPVSLLKYVTWPVTIYVKWLALALMAVAVVAVTVIDRVWKPERRRS